MSSVGHALYRRHCSRIVAFPLEVVCRDALICDERVHIRMLRAFLVLCLRGASVSSDADVGLAYVIGSA